MIDKNDFRLTDFVLGELSDSERAEIQNAIAQSPELAGAVDEIRQTIDQLGEAYREEEPLSLHDSQKAELAKTGMGLSGDEWNSHPNSSAGVINDSVRATGAWTQRRWLQLILAASLVGLLVGGAFYLNQPGPVADVAHNTAEESLEIASPDASESESFPRKSGDAEIANKMAGLQLGISEKALVDNDQSNDNRRLAETKSIVGLAVADSPEDGRSAMQAEIPALTADSGTNQPARIVIRSIELSGKLNENTSGSLAALEANVQGAQNPGQANGFGGRGGGGGGLGGGSGLGRDNETLGRDKATESDGFDVYGVGDLVDNGQPMTRAYRAGRFDEGGDGELTLEGAIVAFPNNLSMIPNESFDASESQSDLRFLQNSLSEANPVLGGFARPEGGGEESPAVMLPGSSELDGQSADKDAEFGMEVVRPQASRGTLPGSKLPADTRRSRALTVSPSPANANRYSTDESDPAALAAAPLSRNKSSGAQTGGGRGRTAMDVPTQTIELSRLAKSAGMDKKTDLGKEAEQLADLGIMVGERRFGRGDGKSGEPLELGSAETGKDSLFMEPERSKQIIERLSEQVDPDGKRVMDLRELVTEARTSNYLYYSKVDEIRAKGKNSGQNSQSEDRSKLIAEKLYENLPALKDEAQKDGVQNESSLDFTPVLKQLVEDLNRRNREIVRKRTWKRVKAIPNTSRLMIGNKGELDLTGMQVKVQIDGFRARVLIDCFYYNDRGRVLEGNFKLRIPDDASLYYFAFGESAYDFNPKGELANDEFLGEDEFVYVSLGTDEIREARKGVWSKVKESRMVPREKAALAFRETVRRKIDPALVEWSGAGVFNARIFPLAPHKLHRIVIGYDVNLKKTDDDLTYELELPEQTGKCRVDLMVQPVKDVNYSIEPVCDPVEKIVDGTTFARYRFSGQKIGTIRLSAHDVPEVLLESSDDAKGKFWGGQVTPELPREEVAGAARAIFLVDTSLSSNPDKFNVWLKMLEATLTNNRDSLKQFGVLFFNVSGNFWQEKYVDNTPENVEALLKTCNTLSLEGATDLYGAIDKINRANWVNGADASLRGERSGTPDLFLLSDGAANWGETNLRLMSRQLDDGKLGRLFAYQTGLNETAIPGLRFLAGQSGGAVFNVTSEAEVKIASTAHRKRPWELKSVSAVGATDLMTAGRVQWVYPGQVITIVGRGTVEDAIELTLEQDGKTMVHSVTPARIESELASRLYGQVAVGQLESLGAKVFDISAAYARHFRVTGRTCSLLMLESEADYTRFNIVPEEDLLVINTKSAGALVMETLEKFALDLADPKAQLLAWMERLETIRGVHFKMPTALKLAMDDIQIVAITDSLDCELTRKDGLSKEYLDAILVERLDYEMIEAEATRRGRTSVDEAIKVYSSLVERNPGDLVIARDVAFTAMEMDRPAPAFHLLRNVARRHPFEGSVYPALGQCLTKLGQADMAIVYYEIALGGQFQNQGADFRKIVSAEYLHLLRQIGRGEIESSVKGYAAARLETLRRELNFDTADLLITMMWNTNATDVDLHVTEPSGEECSYENTRTRAGGRITTDITTGFGPEMYFIADAPQGKYDIRVKYFSSQQSRTELRNKVHLTIYRGFGTEDERVTRKTVLLKTVGEKESISTVGIGK